MNDWSDKIVTEAQVLFDGIERNRDILPFVKLTGDRKLIRQSQMLIPVRDTIIRSLQSGNYRRAVRYITALKIMLRNIEASKGRVENILTEKLVE